MRINDTSDHRPDIAEHPHTETSLICYGSDATKAETSRVILSPHSTLGPVKKNRAEETGKNKKRQLLQTLHLFSGFRQQ